MIVYVESNFILEWAAAQEEHEYCEQVIALAEAGEIQLVLPAFSISEPIHTLHRRHTERKELQQQLNKDISLLSRTGSYEDRLRHGVEVVSILDESRREEQRRLDEVLERITGAAEIIPLGQDVVARARQLRGEADLKHPDAVVLASVLTHLETTNQEEHKLFLQRDRKDFLSPDINELLDEFRCVQIGGFQGGIGRIQAERE